MRTHPTTEQFTHEREWPDRWGLLEGIRRKTDNAHLASGTESEDFVTTELLRLLGKVLTSMVGKGEPQVGTVLWSLLRKPSK